MVGAEGGGIRGLGEGSGYFLRGEGGIVLVGYEAEGQRRWGFGREKIMKEHLCYLSWV